MPWDEILTVLASGLVMAGLTVLATVAWPRRNHAVASAVLLMLASYGLYEFRDAVEHIAVLAFTLSKSGVLAQLAEKLHLLWPLGEAGLMMFGGSWLYFTLVFTAERDTYRPPRKLVLSLQALAIFQSTMILLQLARYLPGARASWQDILGAAYLAAWGILAATILAGLANLLRGYFSARSLSVRRGARWMLWCVSIAAVSAAVIVGPEQVHLRPVIKFAGDEDVPALIFFACLLYMLRRHRALDVDLVINRSLVYGGLTVVLVTIYSVCFAFLDILYPTVGHGEYYLAPFLLGVVATLALLPFGGAVQSFVNRVFYHDGYDYRRTLLNLSSELSRTLELKSILNAVLDAVTEALRCQRAWIMLLDENKQCYTVEAARGLEPVSASLALPADSVHLGPSEVTIGRAATLSPVKSSAGLNGGSTRAQTALIGGLDGASLVIPIVKGGLVKGLLCLGEGRWRDVYAPEDMALLRTVSNQAALAIANAELYAQMERLNKQLQQRVDEKTRELRRANELLQKLHAEAEREASTDCLTGLYNRRYLQEKLSQEVAKARAVGDCVSLVFIDVDGLKVVNDTYGHLRGDEELKRVAKTIKSEIRPSDIPVRFGGDEFVIVLPGTGRRGAEALMKRIKRRLDTGEAGDCPVPVSVSIGVAAFPDDASSEWELIDLADRASYQAKREGRTSSPRPESQRPQDDGHMIDKEPLMM